MLKFILILNFAISGSSFVLEADEKCVSTLTNSEGLCVEPLECELFPARKFNLNICSFMQKLPIICCPISSVKTSDLVKSKSAISKYFQYLYILKFS